MQQAAEIDIEIYQGAAFEWPLIWQAGTPLAPVDLTGYTAYLTVFRKGQSDPAVIVSSQSPTAAGSVITVAPTEGRIDVLVVEEETAPLTWREGSYVLEVTPRGGHVRRLAQGQVRVVPRRETF
jgi:hypothetical protein